MGLVHTEITLTNVEDIFKAKDGIITNDEIRQTKVTAMVDTGAGTLVINEAVRQILGLGIEGTRQARLADGAAQHYDITEPVNVQWKNRDSTCRALVLPNASNVLLGAIPLEDMDLIVDPKEEKLTGRHGDEIVQMIL